MRTIIYIVFFTPFFCFTQKTTTVPVNISFDQQQLVLNQNNILSDSSSITFSTAKFYVMNAVVFSKGKQYKMDELAKLIDADSVNELSFNGKFEHIDSVSFLLGTTTEVNTAGLLEGDLDPIHGMYWAWNSGYINLKLEGDIIQNKKKTAFEYHLGGYKDHQISARTITLHPTNFEISIDLLPYFQQMDFQQFNSIMIPGDQTVTLMNLLANSLK